MRPTCMMRSAHRAPIVDSTLSGYSALSQTGLAHHTSDIFNIEFSIQRLEYSIPPQSPLVIKNSQRTLISRTTTITTTVIF